MKREIVESFLLVTFFHVVETPRRTMPLFMIKPRGEITEKKVKNSVDFFIGEGE